MNQPHSAMEMDLCDLLLAMKLEQSRKSENVIREECLIPAAHDEDSTMLEAHPSPCSNSSRSNSPLEEQPTHGCAFLQAIQNQVNDFPTTGGEYIETIFTHRQILFAFPAAHRSCAQAFLNLSALLQGRSWRADRESDSEAVTAFKYEAQFMISVMA